MIFNISMLVMNKYCYFKYFTHLKCLFHLFILEEYFKNLSYDILNFEKNYLNAVKAFKKINT